MQRWMAFVLFLVLLVVVAAALWYVGGQKTIRAEFLTASLPGGVSLW